MERNARLPLSIHQNPIDRSLATVFGKKRAMKVEASSLRNVKNFSPDELAVIE